MSTKRNISKSAGPLNLWIYCRALIRGYLLSLILFLVSGALIAFTSLGEGIISIITSIILILSVAYGAIYIAAKIGSRGWLHGAIVGLAYILILVFFSKLFISEFSFDKYVSYRILISVATGFIGGMIGINVK
ncbi:TIGR04086 family membrane protein [Alkaliphilus serpentinus]|uniref:TIGR04086 family membrane protein n=1 Tax=Alkaliphilus serpentinus TaxID=1482731 RepID=A0A833HMJ6_9FIRM|nr:TIGR04086 family membrane protein [Alkaliphilus serpentinus]KAB3527675.1 TIGR04086 family membrane protein [Alkaliphilus serpentinus]